MSAEAHCNMEPKSQGRVRGTNNVTVRCVRVHGSEDDPQRCVRFMPHALTEATPGLVDCRDAKLLQQLRMLRVGRKRSNHGVRGGPGV